MRLWVVSREELDNGLCEIGLSPQPGGLKVFRYRCAPDELLEVGVSVILPLTLRTSSWKWG